MAQNKSRLFSLGGQRDVLRLVHTETAKEEDEDLEAMLEEIGGLLKYKVKNPLDIKSLSSVLRSTGYMSESKYNEIIEIVNRKKFKL